MTAVPPVKTYFTKHIMSGKILLQAFLKTYGTLKWSRVDLQERIVYMPDAQKGARTADRAIPKDALEALRAWAREDTNRPSSGPKYPQHLHGVAQRPSWCGDHAAYPALRLATPFYDHTNNVTSNFSR